MCVYILDCIGITDGGMLVRSKFKVHTMDNKEDLLRLLHPIIRQYIALQEIADGDRFYWEDDVDANEPSDERVA